MLNGFHSTPFPDKTNELKSLKKPNNFWPFFAEDDFSKKKGCLAHLHIGS